MTWLALIVLGRLVTWLAQTSGPTKRIWRLHPLLGELGGCDLCLGVWIFTALAAVLGCNIMAPVYVPGLSEFLTGCAVSFGVHLGRIGWQAQYGTTLLDSEQEPP